MSSAINSPAASVVHEAIDERQYVRTKMPAQVVLESAGASVACQIEDISLGGLSLRAAQQLPVGSLHSASIQLNLNQVVLKIDARIKVTTQTGEVIGAQFVDLDGQKRDILRYIISAYMSGELVDVNGLFNVMQRENHIKQRKHKLATERSLRERLQAIAGSALYLLAGLAIASVLVFKAYLLFFRVAATQALVSADAHVISMPENGYVKFLVPAGTQRVAAGQPIATVSTQLATSFTTPADLQALAEISQTDLQALLGRSLIETTIASPCDCYLYLPKAMVDGYGYKFAELAHLIPFDDNSLFVKASFPFDKLKDLNNIASVEMQVFGVSGAVSGQVVGSALDPLTQQLLLQIQPDQPLPLAAYQKPVAVDLFKGLPLLSGFSGH
jgi:alginate biosynthesis protein Alg44